MRFVEAHGLWSREQTEAAREVERRVANEDIEVIRFSCADVHGVTRGKTLVAASALNAMRGGVALTSTMLLKDTSHRTAFPVFSAGGGFGMKELQGAADLIMVADPTTFHVLPWARKTGWLLCDVYFRDGRPFPFSTRALMKSAVELLAAREYEFIAGLEVEFHLFKLMDPRLGLSDSGQPGAAPEVELLSQGYQYLTEQRFDQLEPAVELIRSDLQALGLPLRSIEVEMGPSQVEMTFEPRAGLAAADLMVLVRSAIKQSARRHGLHATFMCRPRIPNVMSSGWHLHQSLRSRDGENAFMARGVDASFSQLARGWLGGLLDHAREAALFTTPTINGYRRYRANSLAPDRAIWASENRGVMVRAIGGRDDPATRLENRVGEPTANPYIYMASQILSGLDGVSRDLDPGPGADAPYETRADRLPTTIEEAIATLDASAFFRARLGDAFVDYLLTIKRAELARFNAEVSEWEQREYFDLF